MKTSRKMAMKSEDRCPLNVGHTPIVHQVSDFTAVFTTMPALLGLGLSMQFTVMPVLGFLLSRSVTQPDG